MTLVGLPSGELDRSWINLPPPELRREGPDGLHLLRGATHHLLSPDHRDHAPLGVMLPLDDWFPARIEAALAFWRTLRHEPPSEPHPISRTRRTRLILGLRALDARSAGVSYRDLARGLFGDARIPTGHAWKTHDLRSRVLRIVADAVALRDGGYRTLIQPEERRMR